ncbi:MAG: DegT/DnrJ/EryC1/StrS family aminotransferase [Candidatus Nealsonbacteria bacterium]
MKVSFVGYKIQYQNLKEEIDSAIHRVLENGDLILRQDVEDFEKTLADFVGAKYAVSLNSGTDALFLTLKALGICEGDEVITVSHTFVASISTIVQSGAKPVLIEVGEDFVMDTNELEKAITSKTKAIIPVYLNGRMCNMDEVMDIAKKHNLYVIEDSAQALGASFNGKKAGSIGITGCFSFYPAKILGCYGDGGAITTNNFEIAQKIILLRDHGQKTKTDIACFGWNSRLDNLQAGILNVRIKYLSQWIERRRKIADMYNKGLLNIKGVELPPSTNSDERYYDVFQNYVLRVKNRDKLFNFLKDKGVETLIKDPIPNHWHKGLNLSHFKLEFSEQLAKEVISLPIYPELTNEQVNYTISCVKEFFLSR